MSSPVFWEYEKKIYPSVPIASSDLSLAEISHNMLSVKMRTDTFLYFSYFPKYFLSEAI